MMNILNNNLAKEIITVLAYLDDSFVDRIPNDLFETLSDLAADSSIDVHIDLNKKLSEQNLSNECLDFIAYLYYGNSLFH